MQATGKTYGLALAAAPDGAFVTLTKVNPVGALQARKGAKGTTFYWRYSVGAKTERVVIGTYDSAAPPKSLSPTERGFGINAAIAKAQHLAAEHYAHREQGGRPALLKAREDAQAAKDQQEHEAAEAQRKAAELAQKYTLKNLLLAYCDHLQAIGRNAHRDARSIFALHVFECWSEVAATPARSVTDEQIADMMRRLIDLGKGRTANKLRSYVRAAYQTAKAARSNPKIPQGFKDYGIVHNPAADTAPDESANRAAKKPLTVEEMRTYWKAIKTLPGFRGAVLRLHLLTGGQRIEQLVCLKSENVQADAFTLMDSKGRPGKPPRPHVVPLTPLAAQALKEAQSGGAWALSTDGGETHLAATTLSAWACEAGADIPGFLAKRLRSGVETALAAAGVSKDIRGHLQSHGIAGVQARSYDGHLYVEEKLAALLMLQKLITDAKRPGAQKVRAHAHAIPTGGKK